MPQHIACDMARSRVSHTIKNLMEGRHRLGQGHISYKDRTAFEHVAQCQEGLCSSARAQLMHVADMQPKNS